MKDEYIYSVNMYVCTLYIYVNVLAGSKNYFVSAQIEEKYLYFIKFRNLKIEQIGTRKIYIIRCLILKYNISEAVRDW